MVSARLLLLLSVYLVLFLGILVFFFCTDEEAPGIKGKIAIFFIRILPNSIRSLIINICGQNVWRSCYGTYDYIVYQRNPLMQGIYLFIINAAFMGWLVYGLPQLPLVYVPSQHIYLPYIGVALSQLTFYLACSVSPGRLTPENVHCFGHQPYDGLLYPSGLFCKTCRVPKVLYII
jgi:palmitoyltransferase ZDHHC4